MQLTYRGINYQPLTPAVTDSSANEKFCPHGDRPQTNKVMLIKPINFYTYRGVSYTKNLTFDSQTKLLLDIKRR